MPFTGDDHNLTAGAIIPNGTQSDAVVQHNTPLTDISDSLSAVAVRITGKQAIDATLTSLSALGTAADKMAYTTGVDVWAETPLTAFARTVLDDADAATARTTLGAQTLDATLTSLSALGTAADKIAYTTGVDTWAEATITAAGRALIDDADIAAQRTTLSVYSKAETDALDLVDPNGPRNPIVYYGANQIAIAGQGKFAMGGHRFKGRFKRNKVPVFAEPALSDSCRHIIGWGNGVTQGDLAFETKSSQYTWYAAFACANNGASACVFKVVPFLRVKSIAGSVITLASTRENELPTTTKYHVESGPTNVNGHFFTTDVMNGSEVLVINERLNGRKKAFSGRLTTATANTTTTVTLSSVGTMEEGDWFLPAPIYDHYAYIGCWYAELGTVPSADLRNLFDTGSEVMTRGGGVIDNTGAAGFNQVYTDANDPRTVAGVPVAASIQGAVLNPTYWDDIRLYGVDVWFDTLMSPLSLGVRFRHTDTIVTSPTSLTGADMIQWGGDNVHDTWRTVWYKDITWATRGLQYMTDNISFSFHPRLHFQRLTTFAQWVSPAVIIQGWVEP